MILNKKSIYLGNINEVNHALVEQTSIYIGNVNEANIGLVDLQVKGVLKDDYRSLHSNSTSRDWKVKETTFLNIEKLVHYEINLSRPSYHPRRYIFPNYIHYFRTRISSADYA